MTKISHLIYLENLHFAKQLEKLKKELKNKKILLYGAGEFFKVIKDNFSLNDLNIIGIADLKFEDFEDEYYEGYKTYKPDDIFNVECDVILFTTKLYFNLIISYLKNQPKNSKIKLIPICQKKDIEILKELRGDFTSENFYDSLKKIIAFKIYRKFNIAFFLKYSDILNSLRTLYILYTFAANVPEKKVLVIEPNSYHGETIPSIYKYFLDCGYKIDILINTELQKTKPLNLKCLSGTNIKKYVIKKEFFKRCLENKNLNKYEYIFLNSYNTNKGLKWESFLNNCNLKFPKSKILAYAHLIEYFENNTPLCTIFKLANTPSSSEIKILNPHYFGEAKINPKNKITNFITVGNIETKRKNHNLLIDAANDLYKKGYKNFKITVVGKGDFNLLPKHLKPFFNLTGRITYPKMYKEMEKADFFLPLLDPNNNEHDRYITTGTSGSFQLIYGFCKPCLIHEKFAKPHGFNNLNSLIYKNNEELSLLMESAITLSQDNYENLQNNIKNLAKSLYNESLKNLQNILNIK